MQIQRLKEKYLKEIGPEISKELATTNKKATPEIVKVAVNVGVGALMKNKEGLERVKKDLAAITGQVPAVRQSKVSVASFGIRRGMPVGLMVTLRGERMYAFLDRLFSIVLPRLRDFRGVGLKGFDNYGNYTLGLREHTVFPEVDLVKSPPHGLEITIVTNTKNKEASKKLLEKLGMPFEKN